jgi:hypothetical protein
MEFRVAGTGYRCPLYEFQPRTEILAIAEAPAGRAETVERARVRAETTPIAKAE